ncbi:MAG: ankyrin repeat domain-containing protein, partial [Bacteroidota bacterium]|nr:ankyrin repeat domain-containing protein [Bacteroidota bacterium]
MSVKMIFFLIYSGIIVMSRTQGIATQNNNQQNNQQEPHPGSLQHRNNIKNYIVYFLKKACKKPTSDCKLWLLSLLGEDCFETEIIDRIEDHDCRTKKNIKEYYQSYNDFELPPFVEIQLFKTLSTKSIHNNDFAAFMNFRISKDAVFVAAYNGSIKFLQAIKDAGCNLCIKNVYNITPAYMAVMKGHEACLRLLKEAGCELGHADNHGWTPAFIAARNGHTGCLQVLKEAGCDLGRVDDCGRTLAYMAAENGHESCLRVLKEAGCDLGQAGEHGRTLAYWAARNGHESCLRVLQEAGCDLEQASYEGETPVHIAAAEGHESCLRVLKNA